MEKKDSHSSCCPVFGVESGIPMIGLGILLILFAIVPVLILHVPFSVPVMVLLVIFGLLLIWAGLTR